MRTLVSISKNARPSPRHSSSRTIPPTIYKPNRKNYSTLPIISPQTDQVKVNVKVGSSGSIPLRIHPPPRPSPTSPILLYFPSSLPSQEQSDHDPLTTLSLSAHATTVHIAYRLSPQTPFPRPIHDVLAAYDWVRKHLVSVPQQTNHDPHSKYTNQSNPSKPVGVIGEFAGGSLAASLALTECHSYKPGAIKAAALGNAVVDWSSPFQNSDSDAHEEEVMERDLLSLRSRAFSRPADRYDPFASPLLFFRTPAWELVPEPVLYGFPPSSSASASASASSPVSNENDDSELARDTTSSSPAASKQEGKGEEELIPKWRSHRKYPPLGSGLRLPQTRIEICTSGGGGVLREQGMEMAELMQRSVDVLARDDHGFEMASQGGEREGRWKRRVELVEREGRGGGRGMLWGEKEMVEVGAWIGEALRSR